MQIKELPSLEHFTRAELEELIRVLHGALSSAVADYNDLHRQAMRAVEQIAEVAR